MATKVPQRFERAIIAYEDQRFYSHPGIDPKSVLRAIRNNWRAGSVVEGASTLSMQVIRLSRKGKPRTLWQKLIESMLAIRLELSYSKADILKLYAGAAPFGGNVVGLETAAWRYFGRSPERLSWAESATLAVLPNAPGLIHPGRNRAQLKSKRDLLLRQLGEQGWIDPQGVQLAMTESLPAAPLPLPKCAPHLLLSTSNSAAPITTTIDFHLQQSTQQILEQHQVRLAANHIHNAAVLVLDVDTKAVLAYHGNLPGAGDAHQEQVDCIRAPRSTGSILKPFLYAFALDEGTILPHSILSDIPTQINGYRPQNYHRSFDGVIAAHQALSKSLNIPMVRLLQKYGLEKFHQDLQGLGLKTLSRPPDDYGLTLILGGAEATLWDLGNAYASMAKELKTFCNSNSLYAANAWESPSWQSPIDSHQMQQANYDRLSAGAIWATFQAMQQVSRPDQSGRWEIFESGVPIAWKTGTSFGFRDAWAIGVAADHIVAVWVGNANGEGRPQCIGTLAAAPILFDIFRQLEPQSILPFVPYDDLSPIEVCASSGWRSARYCPKDSLLVPNNSLKAMKCTYHLPIQLNAEQTARVSPSCYTPEKIVDTSWYQLPPIESAYYRQKHPSYASLPSWLSGCDGKNKKQLDLVYPGSNAKLSVPVDVDGERSELVFEAAHSHDAAKIHWYLDGESMGTTELFHSLSLRPAAGTHRIVLVDQWGERLESSFEVVEN